MAFYNGKQIYFAPRVNVTRDPEELKALIEGSLTDFEIPNGVKTIRERAFSNCRILRYVNIPESVTTIGDYAFYFSTLQSITIPDSVTKLGNYIFTSCHSLKSVTYGAGITDIGKLNTQDCTSLVSLTLGKNLKTIGNQAIATSRALESLIIPESVTTIASGAFYILLGLKSVIFKGTPTSMGTQAFNSCKALTDIYVPWAYGRVSGAPWGATNATVHYNYRIDDISLVYEASSDKSYYTLTGYKGTSSAIVIPDTINDLPVKIIGRDALRDQKVLTNITIGNNVETIGYASLMNSGVTSLIIPESVRSIEAHSVRTVALKKLEFANTISVTEILSSAFYGTAIEEVTLPWSLWRLDVNAFKNCTSLKKVIFQGVTRIFSGTAFDGCTALTEIHVPWKEGTVANAPWGAPNAEIIYESPECEINY